MATSKRTSKFRLGYWIFEIISILANIVPLATYAIIALINADLVHEKVVLSMTVMIVLIMSAIAYVNKTISKSRIWVILIGIYVCLDNIITPLIIIGICQILDEIIFTPSKSYFKLKLKINKELDTRL